MPRVARIVVPNLPHHVTQRGNNRQDVFFVKEDRERYLEILQRLCAKHRVSIEGYCLMTNHVHLIVTPKSVDTLAKAIGRTHFAYTQYVNRLHGRSGHLWQNRFFSCALDETHYLHAMRYVETNPVRARLNRVPWRYPWSSAMAHVTLDATPQWLDASRFCDLTRGWNWKEYLMENAAEATDSIRLATSRGRPLATDLLLSKLESKLKRRLRPLPHGRPKKEAG